MSYYRNNSARRHFRPQPHELPRRFRPRPSIVGDDVRSRSLKDHRAQIRADIEAARQKAQASKP
jgi:hypothetical protein